MEHLAESRSWRYHRPNRLVWVYRNLNQIGSFAGKGFLQQTELILVFDSYSGNPVCTGKNAEVRDRPGASLGVAAFVENGLPLPHHAQYPVVEEDDLNRDAVASDGRKLLDVHLEGAIAGDKNHTPIGSSELCSDGCR